jgi:hypothetical protein
MSVPLDDLVLLSAVGDACAGRRLGFGRRRADLAARFARRRGASEELVVAGWVAGALAELGLVRAPTPADAPLHGARLVDALGLPAAAADMVRWHREHDDGTGGPDHLRWDGIPADAAALGIAHAFLEAVEDREEPRPPAEALFVVVAEGGRRFSVELVRAFRAFVTGEPEGWDAPLALALPAPDPDALATILKLAQEAKR